MSENACGSQCGGLYGGENAAVTAKKFEAIIRSVRWCLTSGSSPRVRGDVSETGVAHTLAVCMVELTDMARGNSKAGKAGNTATMPKFVDIKLTQEDKADFIRQNYDDKFLVTVLQSLCDDGYRVGCTWDAERQAYTVSLTCRNFESPNSGLCMTSFAKTIRTAVGLAVYKHTVITEENWLGEAGSGSEDFG